MYSLCTGYKCILGLCVLDSYDVYTTEILYALNAYIYSWGKMNEMSFYQLASDWKLHENGMKHHVSAVLCVCVSRLK